MKDKVGILRKIDNLGRVVVPKEMRKALNIQDDCYLSFMIKSDYITIKPMSEAVECKDCGTFMTTIDKFCSQCGSELALQNVDI